ncbi:TetR family transcriptional regulator [Chryseobacterium taklimakanense]|uniref:TetR family transcriptional regulator n=1 Tax=Chryseobacterium taklimakanense TaxID=536441 RepID=A0A3G8WFS1_9FLAO|nr:TetR family transcriptional regulator [Chryseobacterium taklimakanense]AZI19982.1 TetR family transcriptional regulator [Chryseobacterium taklimakanense]
MEDKKQFLQKATELFIEHGSKTLTMDDVAREFEMSKKRCISTTEIKRR